MCIRDRVSGRGTVSLIAPNKIITEPTERHVIDGFEIVFQLCLLYTSDAADDLLCVDLGGRRIIKKKNTSTQTPYRAHTEVLTTPHSTHSVVQSLSSLTRPID